MTKYVLRRWGAICLAALFLAVIAFAQSDNSTISGIVKDPSGAAVSGAKVVVRNEGTGFERQVTTNDSGFYTAPNLAPGYYYYWVINTGIPKYPQADSPLGNGARGGVASTYSLLCATLRAGLWPATVAASWSGLPPMCAGPPGPGNERPVSCSLVGRGRPAHRSPLPLSSPYRGRRVRCRDSVRRHPTERTVRQLPQQQTRQKDAQRGDRVRVMPLGADPATRVDGSLSSARRQRIQDDRRGRRGKNGSARPPGTHKPRCTVWRGGGTRASYGLRSVPALILVSAPRSPVR